jgi:hypothetical protein
MLSKSEIDSKIKKSEYKITVNGTFSSEWKITNFQGLNKYLKFHSFSPCTLLDTAKNPVGKISSEKLFSCKKTIKLDENSSIVRAYLKPKLGKFILTGMSNIRGFEEINWNCKLNWSNSKFVLISQNNGYDRAIAEFKRSTWSFKDIGTLYIFEEFPYEINSLIIYSICYCIKHVKRREATAAASGAGGGAC